MKDEKDWSKATDEELIKKTKTDYTIGTIFKSVRDGLTCYVSAGNINISDTSIFVDGNKVFDCMRNKWAEIISQPKEETDHEGIKVSVKHLDEIGEKQRRQIMEAITEPKAGDMVEAIRENGDWSKNLLYYTGGKDKYGDYVVIDDEGEYDSFSDIRLPQKSEVESKAKELRSAYVQTNFEPEIIQYGIDCIKWGQQNPDKK